jgi:two-component system chemotaxis response regulator CheB
MPPEIMERRPVGRRRLGFVLIGVSTGGPTALARLLPRFPSAFPAPILVCQHMTSGFTAPLAAHLNRLCSLPVEEARDGHPVTPGRIFLAPSGTQTRVVTSADGQVRFRVGDTPGWHLYRPCIDLTLTSLAPIYQETLVSIILTGMGKDGRRGCRVVKAHGGYVIAEAEETCVVYGMPRAVAEAGLADRQLPLDEIYNHIESLCIR